MRLIVPHVRLIHSVASESALRELERWRELARPGIEILIEVNVAGEPGKAGVAPARAGRLSWSARPVPVSGLMTMPPLTDDPRESRRWFAALRELAASAGPARALDGDHARTIVVAVEEGATIVRIGTRLYARGLSETVGPAVRSGRAGTTG